MFARHAVSSGRAASPEIRTAPLKAEPITSTRDQGNLELVDGRSRGTSPSSKCATPRASNCLVSGRSRALQDSAQNAKVVPLLSMTSALSFSAPSTQGGSFAVPMPTKDPLAPPALRSSHSTRSTLPASLASTLGPPKVAVARTLSKVSSGLAQGICQSSLDRSRGVRTLSPQPRTDYLSFGECYRTEQESGGNASTTASSVCDSHHGSLDNMSCKVIFAKVSEMIRMEIATCERRMNAKLEAERAERKSACDKAASDLESLVTVVEALSGQNDQHSIATLLEEERRLRDMACVSLHCKLEALTCLVRTSSAAAQTNEDMNGQSRAPFADDMMLLCASESADEAPMENRGTPGNMQRINGCDDPMTPPPKGLIPCSKIDEEYLDALLEQERRARELACATLRTDLCKELQTILEACTETNLNRIAEHERRARDVACATLRAEICKELEAMSMDVRSISLRIPEYDAMEREHKALVLMYGRLRNDVHDLASDARRRGRTKSPSGSTSNRSKGSTHVGDRLPKHDSPSVAKR